MTEREGLTPNGDQPSVPGLPDMAVSSPEPDWLPQASDASRWDQISAAFDKETQWAGDAVPVPEPVSATEQSPSDKPTQGEAEDLPEVPPAAAALPSRRQMRLQEEESRRRRKSPAMGVIFALLGLIGAVMLVLWLVNTFSGNNSDENAAPVERNENPGADGVIALDVPANQFEYSDCLTDYTGPTEPATVVECTAPHEAQLVGRKVYAQNDSYPGDDAIVNDAQEFCNGLVLRVPDEVDFQVTLTRPVQQTWNTGDRTVDCLLEINGEPAERTFLTKAGKETNLQEAEESDPTGSPSPTESE